MKNIQIRLGLCLVILAISLVLAWPRPERPILNMKLGLDLKGGSRLVMEVQQEDAVKSQANVVAQRLASALQADGFAEANPVAGEVGEIRITGLTAARADAARSTLQRELSEWTIESAADGLVVKMPQSEIDRTKENAVSQAMQTIENRVNAFGVGETTVARIGGAQRNRILVELPGVEDPSRVKRIIQVEAQLELRRACYNGEAGPFFGATANDVVAALGGRLPPACEILESLDATAGSRFMAVERASVITGADLQTADVQRDEFGRPAVGFELKVDAVRRFAEFTGSNIGRLMPIVIDRKIKSAPSINNQISRSGIVQGSFTAEEAQDLALTLRSGALPARVLTIEERTVGPSLGKDSIDQGLKASALGALLVVCFMVIWYKGAGINAVVTLAANLLIVAGVMAWLDATLTLPGIAGYALTIGMAVDANVLIFERIREELRSGKTVRAAIDTGFGKAFGTIFDSNLTTIIAAFFLMMYGTGPVKGFAVSLTAGLLANMFTAVYMSRTLFELVLGNRSAQKLSI